MDALVCFHSMNARCVGSSEPAVSETQFFTEGNTSRHCTDNIIYSVDIYSEMCSQIIYAYRSVWVEGEQIQSLFSSGRSYCLICLWDILWQDRWQQIQKETVRNNSMQIMNCLIWAVDSVKRILVVLLFQLVIQFVICSIGFKSQVVCGDFCIQRYVILSRAASEANLC